VLIAVITLGLGIGANTSAFSILNEAMFRPLPYPDSDRLDCIYRATPRNPRGAVSAGDYLDLISRPSGYQEIAAYGPTDMSLAEPGHPADMVRGVRVSANLFATLGVEPRLGRAFRPEEAVAGNHRVLVSSHRYWQRQFAGDAGIVGRTVRVDGEPHEIVGVLPAAFDDWRHLGWADLFRPLGLGEKETRDRSSDWLHLVGRRPEGLTREQAASFVADFGRRLAEELPDAGAGATWRTLSIYDSVLEETDPRILGMLIGLSGFVLLIACSNLANLLLARTMARARELAVRAALGASRIRLLRPLLVESLLVALAGGAGAILVAMWTFDWIASVSVGDSGEGIALALDGRIVLWALGASLFTAVAFGVAPALFALKLDLNQALRSGGRGVNGDRGHRRFRQLIIVSQFALAMVLLGGAALFVSGLRALSDSRDGWESDHLVTGTILLPTATYPGEEEITRFQRLALARLEALPGVESASISGAMPFFGSAEARKFLVAGREAPGPGREPAALVNGVTPHYFETVGTRLLAGRIFGAGDTRDAPRVFVINQAMARGLFGDESPIGRRIARAGGKIPNWGEIVGVVGDVRTVYPDGGKVTYQLYHPLAQEPQALGELAVRTAGAAPSTLVAGIRAAITQLDPDLPVRKLQPADSAIARANHDLGILGSMLSFLAVLGLGLAALGIYGVIARTVALRTGEFGIRLALGAQTGDIARLVLASGAKLALVGSALGLAGAGASYRLIAAVFPGIQAHSAIVLGGVTLVLTGVAQLACYIPARNASRISPVEALRAE